MSAQQKLHSCTFKHYSYGTGRTLYSGSVCVKRENEGAEVYKRALHNRSHKSYYARAAVIGVTIIAFLPTDIVQERVWLARLVAKEDLIIEKVLRARRLLRTDCLWQPNLELPQKSRWRVKVS